jgi:plastocyanin
MRIRDPLRVLLVGLALALVIAPMTTLAAPARQMAPSELTVLVGAGQDTQQLLNYFPASIRVRAGDTVTWNINGDELHSASFTQNADFPPFPASSQAPVGKPGERIPTFAVPLLGGGPTDLMINPLLGFPTRAPGAPVETYSGFGFASSGLLQKQTPPGAPPNKSMSLVFDAPGTYNYLCLIHTDRMFGTIEVVAEDQDADSQDTITQRARAEIAAEMTLLGPARDVASITKKEPGLNNSTISYVRAGMSDVFSGDGRAQLMEFLPKDLTVKTGDTVIWGSSYFHTISFPNTTPAPEFILPAPQAAGPPLLTLNPLEVLPAKPTAIYDPTRYYNSSDLGPFSPAGYSWSLAFDKPGTYAYLCLVHKDLGMKGTITVVAR